MQSKNLESRLIHDGLTELWVMSICENSRNLFAATVNTVSQ